MTINTTKAARALRYQEYLALKSLPWLSKEQATRFTWLQKQRVKDNKIALKESKL